LIVNAVQATPKGKRVTVRARTQRVAQRVTLRCDVVDEGAGIDAEDASRVFQPFFTTKATGTGLGLAVVRRIADALGGAVEVARVDAGGTRFTLTVPVG
jgi:two-component system, NtrC family, sensor histidine kinase HydH